MNYQNHCSIVQRVILLLKKMPPLVKLTLTVYQGSPVSMDMEDMKSLDLLQNHLV